MLTILVGSGYQLSLNVYASQMRQTWRVICSGPILEAVQLVLITEKCLCSQHNATAIQ